MFILLKTAYRPNATPIKILMAFLTGTGQRILKFVWNQNRAERAKAIWRNKSKSGGIKLYNNATVIKTEWYWHKQI